MESNAAENSDLQSGDTDDNATSPRVRPFVKWVGGKSQLIHELKRRIPKKINRYFRR